MKHISFRILVILLLLVTTSFPGPSFAKDTVTSARLHGSWSGQWSSPDGFIYLAELHLESAGNGTVKGQINWILNRSPRTEEQSKLGLTGIEFVKGTYNPANKVLSIDGYSKTDPNSILGLDKYRLILAVNGAAIGGVTWNHGSWRGLLGLRRTEN